MVGWGRGLVPTRMLRDIATLTIGATLCLSQVLIQFQGGDPNIALITAGVGLLTSYPLLKLGDRRADEGDVPAKDRPDPRSVS